MTPEEKKVSCSNFRLDQKGYSLEDAPVFNQGSTGTCYAHAASTLRTAVEKINGKNSIPNPIELSMVSSYTGGQVCQAYEITEETGWCEASNLDTDTINRFTSFHKRYTVLRENLNSLKDERGFFTKGKDSFYELSMGIRYNRPDAKTIQKYEESLDKIRNNLAVEVKEHIDGIKCLPQQFDEDNLLEQISTALEATDEMEFIEQIKEVCSLSKPNGKSPTKCMRDKKVLAVLEDQFQNVTTQTLPVGVDYCVREAFNNIDNYSLKADFFNFMKTLPDEGFSTSYVSKENKEKFEGRCGHHASVIMGRQFNEETGKCQYMIQNSWGTDCSGYPDHLKCEDGKFWIDEDLLETSAYNINRIVPGGK